MFTDFSVGTNLNTYNDRMRTVIEDKAFFLDHIEFDVLVDYGCADGSLIEYVSERRPRVEFIGFDISQAEIKLAKKRNPNHLFYSDWAQVESVLKQVPRGKKVIMVCNSLIHEIYAYDEDLDQFWSRVTSRYIDAISIRDMFYAGSDADITKEDYQLLRESNYSHLLKSFEKENGMRTYRDFNHFLLKYRYEDNWDREGKENYFSHWTSDLYQNTEGFKMTYYETFIPEFIKDQTFDDIGYQMTDSTHLKIILERK